MERLSVYAQIGEVGSACLMVLRRWFETDRFSSGTIGEFTLGMVKILRN